MISSCSNRGIAHVDGVTLDGQSDFGQGGGGWTRYYGTVDRVEPAIVARAENELAALVPLHDTTKMRADGRETLEATLRRVHHDDRFVVDRHDLALADEKVLRRTYLDATSGSGRDPAGWQKITDDGREYTRRCGDDREA